MLRCGVQISYGANIAKFPAGGYLHVSNINDASGKSTPTPGDWASFGVTAKGKGQVAVLGDTNCLDSSHMVREPGTGEGVKRAGGGGHVCVES
jgi:hypothetical protein